MSLGLRLLPVRMISPGEGCSHAVLDGSSAHDLLSPILDLRPEAIVWHARASPRVAAACSSGSAAAIVAIDAGSMRLVDRDRRDDHDADDL